MRYALLAVLWLPLAVHAEPESKVLQLRRGDVRTLKIPDIVRVAVGDPKLVDVKVTAEGMELWPLAPGRTTLLTWRKNGSRTSMLLVVRGEGGEDRGAIPRSDKAAEDPPNQTLTLSVGEKRAIDFKNVTRMAIGDPSVADVRMVDGQVEVSAAAPGETTLRVWRTDLPPYDLRLVVR